MKLSTRVRNGLLAAFGPFLNSGTLQFRTGAAPANVGDTLTGTLLGTLAFGATAINAPANGSASTSAIGADVDADANGVAGYAVALGSDTGQDVYFGIGLTGSGADIELDTTTFELGGTVAVTGGSFGMPIGSIDNGV